MSSASVPSAAAARALGLTLLVAVAALLALTFATTGAREAAVPRGGGDDTSLAAAFARAPARGAPPAHTTLRAALEAQYARYAPELVEMRALGARFCALPMPAGWPHTNKCLSTISEMELLYMRVRDEAPAHVLEVASAVGYTSMWLLAALGKNNNGGLLHSFDVYDTPFPVVLPEALRASWVFTRGDVHATFARATEGLEFGVILMDAEHTREFGAFYRDVVLKPALVALQARADATAAPARLDMTVHDVYHYAHGDDSRRGLRARALYGVSGEGEVFLAWLGSILPTADFTCWSANDRDAPRRFAMMEQVQRAALGDAATDIQFGQFPRGDLSARCTFWAEPLPAAGVPVSCDQRPCDEHGNRRP